MSDITRHIEQLHSNPDIFRIRVPLENVISAVCDVNCYVVKGDTEDLLIDVAMQTYNCWNVLSQAYKYLNVDLSSSVLFITHAHSDHAGCLSYLAPLVQKRYMSQDDIRTSWEFRFKSDFACLDRFRREGIDLKISQSIIDRSYGWVLEGVLDSATPLNDRDTFICDGREYTAIETPGHSPGHMCLYLKDEQILFSGDLILLHGCSILCYHSTSRNILANDLETLGSLLSLPVNECYMGHGPKISSAVFYERIEFTIQNHLKKIGKVNRALQSAQSGLTLEEVARSLPWLGRPDGFNLLNERKRRFVLEEVLVYLEYLIETGRARRDDSDESKPSLYHSCGDFSCKKMS